MKKYVLDVPNMPVRLGKLNDLSKFDAEFFGFGQPHRVNLMDPMSRIIMEKAYEAVIDSGISSTLTLLFFSIATAVDLIM